MARQLSVKYAVKNTMSREDSDRSQYDGRDEQKSGAHGEQMERFCEAHGHLPGLSYTPNFELKY